MHRLVLASALLIAATSTVAAKPRDPKTAKLLSGVSAAVSGGVVVSGFMFAQDGRPFHKPVLYTGIGLLAVSPSAGEFYSGEYLTWGMGIRAVGTGLALWTLQTQTKIVTCDGAMTADEKCTGFTENSAPLLGVAAIIFIGGVWYDVLDAPDAANRYNRKHAAPLFVPTAMAAPQGLVPGFAVSGRF